MEVEVAPHQQGVCTPVSDDRRVTVNDREAQLLGRRGDCPGLRFRAGRFVEDAPITIRVFDGAQPIGEATFVGAFPGIQSRLVTPIDGRVAAGADVVVAVPLRFMPADDTPAHFYWRDIPPDLPTFRTETRGGQAPGVASLMAPVPNVPGLQGRAALVFPALNKELLAGQSCVGFRNCWLSVFPVAGPIEVEVLPIQAGP